MKLSIDSLKTAVGTYVSSNKIDLSSLSATTNNIVGLVDTIGKIFTLDSTIYDKLPELDGEALSFGKTVEEWQQDLQMPVDYDDDASGDKALKNYAPSYRPVSFSVSLGRKIIPTSIPFGNIERAVHNEAQFTEVVSMITKKQEESVAAWKYQCKRELLGKMVDKIQGLISGATTYVASSTAIVNGSYYTDGTDVAVCVVAKAASAKTFAELVSEGNLVKVAMKKVLALPVDESTGEAFLKSVKGEVEIASDLSEGHSISGNTLGASEGLKLYIKQGVMPSIQVDTLAGAFHKEELAVPAELKVIKDFGSTSSGVYAILMDSRAVRLFEDYNATRSQENGYGDRMNIFRHVEYTGHISNNCFITYYVVS